MTRDGQEPKRLTARPDARHFIAGGDRWSVYEDLRSQPPHCGPALIFVSADTARRVREYPAGWRALSDDELYALSWNR